MLNIEAWRSLVAHLLWEQRAAGSNPVASTRHNKTELFPLRIVFGLFYCFFRSPRGVTFLVRKVTKRTLLLCALVYKHRYLCA